MIGSILKNATSKASLDRWERFKKVTAQMDFLIDHAEKYGSLSEMLNDLSLNPEDTKDDNEPKVTLSTAHSAKGLEWDTVFLINVTDSDYPGVREPKSVEPEAFEEYAEEVEEGRRLLYVAITRARETLYLSMPYASIRNGIFHQQTVSRFLCEENVAYETLCDCHNN